MHTTYITIYDVKSTNQFYSNDKSEKRNVIVNGDIIYNIRMLLLKYYEVA